MVAFVRQIPILVRILVCCLLVSCLQQQQGYAQAPKKWRVVLDAGHGGKDPGCLGADHKEGEMTYLLTRALGEMFAKYAPDVEVIYTRTRMNQFVELRERARIANRNQADLFISIHCNASVSSRVRGTETYVLGAGAENTNLGVALRENKSIMYEEDAEQHYPLAQMTGTEAHILMANYVQTHQANSLKLAECIERKFAEEALLKSRGVKQDRFLVLLATAMPSVLVETGYLTNPDDEAYIASAYGQQSIAAAIFRAFQAYRREVEAEKVAVGQ